MIMVFIPKMVKFTFFLYAYGMVNTLNPGDRLNPNQSATSSNGRYIIIYQGDGNLVLYINGGPALWASNTPGKPSGVCIMQGDGNLVLYTYGARAIWATNTPNHPGSRLIIGDNGNLVIQGSPPNNDVIWQTNTGIPQIFSFS